MRLHGNQPHRDDQCQQQRTTGPVGPPQYPVGHCGSLLTDPHEPAHRRSSQMHHDNSRTRVQHRHYRGEHTQYRRWRHRRGGQQVGQYRHQAHLTGQPCHHRRSDHVGGGGHRKRLGDPRWDPVPPQRRRPARGQQHQRASGQHGERKPGIVAERRIDQ